MSPKTTQSSGRMRLALRKKAKRFDSIMSEFGIKEFEAQERIGNNVCVFLKLKDENKFLVLSKNSPEVRSGGKFFVIAVGASTSELGEARDLVGDLTSAVSDTYSPRDLYPTVLLYFLSRYLKGLMEELWLPRALAVEFMIYDPFFEVLHMVKFNGDYESYALKDVDKSFFIMGGYNDRLRGDLSKESEKLLKKGSISDKELMEAGVRIGKKYGLSVIAVLTATKPHISSPNKPGGRKV